MSLMATARRTRACFSPASRKPRSANTLPELRVTFSVLLPFAISSLVIFCRGFEPARDQFHVRLRRRPALGRFFLERVQHIDSMLKLHCVDGAVSIAAVVRCDFKDAGTSALARFCFRMLPTKLRDAQRHADRILDGLRKNQEIILSRPDPKQGLLSGNGFGSRHGYYPSSRILRLPEILLTWNEATLEIARIPGGIEDHNSREKSLGSSNMGRCSVRYAFAQSCQWRPFTRENSDTFAVTSVKRCRSACPAIRRS